MEKALALLDLDLPPIIHIAGTNGKGSSLAFLRAILECAGKKCHVYTSPHLVTIHERFVIAGMQISEAELYEIALEVQKIAETVPLTIFEAETLAGFIAFSRTPADYLLLETGLGGRLDATNVIKNKALTIITPIDYDHKEYLGDDILQIAREKCGILRENTPAIIARQRDNVLEEIEKEAAFLKAPIYCFGRDFDGFMSYGKYCFQTESEFIELPNPALIGDHQLENAANAIMAAKLLGIANVHIADGVRSAKWPARLQRLKDGKIGQKAVNSNCDVWLDGGHNPHGGRALAAFLEKLNITDKKDLILICGFLSNKDFIGFLSNFVGLGPRIFAIPIETSPNSAKANEIVEKANSIGLAAVPFENFETALKACFTEKNKRVIICGSLYLAGEVLAKIESEGGFA